LDVGGSKFSDFVTTKNNNCRQKSILLKNQPHKSFNVAITFGDATLTARNKY